MRKITSLTLYLYRHHFVRYVFVGGTTFLIDFGILYILHGHFLLNLAASTSVAYWVSILYNFILNRYWTFDAREKESLGRHLTIYFFLLVFNYLFVLLFVTYVGMIVNYIIAKAIAVVLQMTWTYPVYKNYIFVDRSKQLEVSSKS